MIVFKITFQTDEVLYGDIISEMMFRKFIQLVHCKIQ